MGLGTRFSPTFFRLFSLDFFLEIVDLSGIVMLFLLLLFMPFSCFFLAFPPLLDTKKRGKLEKTLRFSLVLGNDLFNQGNSLFCYGTLGISDNIEAENRV
ncbi:hypothetical protein [Metabacillus bambusae]|uniref:Transmembrane protein n=1 Tax=Metabacillus bambusae TaxID=2795218 RepID=A0ABS3N5L0_9BACI|nr:hypothetical protein [Metabacillus bambusae]MBO1513569.1 hypothetical protein [Metabacillus bambusae]